MYILRMGKSRMKKTISFILAALLMISMGTIAFAAPNEFMGNNDEKRNLLISKGMPIELVNSYSDEIISQFYDVLNYENREILSIESNNLCRKELRDTIPTADMDFTMVTVADTTNVGGQKRINAILVGVTSGWKKYPNPRWTDKVTVNWDSSVFTLLPGSFSLNCYVWKEDDTRTNYHSTNRLGTSAQGGIGYDVLLSIAPKGKTIESLAFLQLEPANGPIYEATGYSNTSINAIYTYDKNKLSSDTSFSISTGHVTVNNASACDSAATSAKVSYKK